MDLMARINNYLTRKMSRIEEDLTRRTISKFKKKNPEIDIADDKEIHEIICNKLNILNKMTSEQRKYVLSATSENSPIFSDMYKYNELEKMINSKIEIVQTKTDDNYPDLDKLYHILGSRSYDEFLLKYLNLRDISRYKLFKFSEFAVENKYIFEKIIPKDKIHLNSLLGISLNKLTKCFEYISSHVDSKNYSLILTSLLTSNLDIDIINKLSDIYLIEVLQFLNSEYADEIKYILPFIICEKKDCNGNKGYRYNNTVMNIIKNHKMPLSVLCSFGSNQYNNENKEKLVEFWPCFNEGLITEINQSLNTVGSVTLDILYNDEFLELSNSSIGHVKSIQEKILNSSRRIYNDFLNNENIEYSEDGNRFLEIAEFLLKSDIAETGKRIPNSNFVSLNPEMFRSTVKFICGNDSQKVRKAKMEVLDKIKPQLLQYQTLTMSLHYEQYLNFLSKVLKNKSEKKQINQLKTYGKYFTNHNIEEIFNKIKDSNNAEIITNLLVNCESKKQTKQNLKLVDIIDQYSPKIILEIVKHLENCQTKEQSKLIINSIKNPIFIEMPYDKKIEILNNLPGDQKNISEDNINVNIPDNKYVEQKIIDNGGEMTFKNSESGIKIKIKVAHE